MRATRRLIGLCLAVGLPFCPAAGSDIPRDRPAGAVRSKAGTSSSDLRDLYFGEALYHAFQGQYFDAIQRLDTELGMYHGLDQPELDTLHYHINDAEFSVGDFELDYRMHHRAGRAIKAVLEGAVDQSVRNEAAFRLARIHFQKGQLDDAMHALQRIQGTVPPQISDDVEFLRANILMATGQPSEAVKVLKQLRSGEGLAGFVAYNLGIALLQGNRPQEAIEQLDKAGQLPAADPSGLAIRDKSNLVLGTMLFESGNFERARQSLDRVRIEGPFSNQALLRAGWAEATAKHYDRALVPWNILASREPTDAAVQESMLAVANAYASLNLHGRAALKFGGALELFTNQIQRVDASINSIREGRFLKALMREETREEEDWVITLRTLPDAPETYYLMELMASHDFQTALHNYLDLEDLQSRLIAWRTSLDAFTDIIRLRKQNYEPLLPEVDAQFRKLDSRMRLRLEQRKQLTKRLQAMLTAPRPDYLATADERSASERIALIEKQLGNSHSPEALALRQRAAHLRSTLTWRLETEYNDRLTAATVHLNELNSNVDALTRQYESFVRTRQAATQSYVGYDKQISQLRQRVDDAQQRVERLMAQQGHMIEVVAINQLEARRDRLAAQQTEARYGVAASYDRAARAQAGAEEK
jgi:predicted negative regulator of RcsB-dependent stress response